MRKDFVLPGATCDRETYFAARGSLHDVIAQGIFAASHDDTDGLGSICIISPTDEANSCFQIGLASPDFGQGVQSTAIYACAPMDRVAGIYGLLQRAPLIYGGREQNGFVARKAASADAYGFTITMQPPQMDLTLPSRSKNDYDRLMKIMGAAYIRPGDVTDGVAERFEPGRHADAFVCAVDEGLFPAFWSRRDAANIVHIENAPITPTKQVHPTLAMRVMFGRADGGVRPVSRDELDVFESFLHEHFPQVNPPLWAIRYSHANTIKPNIDERSMN